MDKTQKDIFQYALAAVVVVGFFAVLGALVFWPVPVENKDALNIMLGALVGAFSGGVIGYFFGSSKGSSEKTELMAQDKQG
jgi:membrane protein YqaA with SNARE-associated domain